MRNLLTIATVFLSLLIVINATNVTNCKIGQENCEVCHNDTFCISCKNQYAGDICEYHCSYCKANTRCVKDAKICETNCTDGLSGQYCNQSCDPRCNSCERTNTEICVTCVDDKPCDFCPRRCVLDKCDKTKRVCTMGCMAGYWGDSCEQKCEKICTNNTCDRQNGTCLNGIEKETEVMWCIIALSVILVIIVAVVVYIICKARASRQLEKSIVVYDRQEARIIEHSNTRVEMQQDHAAISTTPKQPFLNSANVKDATSYVGQISEETNQGSKQDVHTKSVEISDSIEELEELCLNGQTVYDILFDDSDTYYNTVALSQRKISLDSLEDYVTNMTERDYMEEFHALPPKLIKPCTEALRKENILKNRYKDMYPYDESRVIISLETYDYINANYIDGYNHRKGYIACVGPTLKFMGDMSVFWRVVWKEECSEIVMLTRLVEAEDTKCDKYWPDKDHCKYYGDISVGCVEERMFKSYTTRIFKIQNLKQPETRMVQQFHYTAWPDKGVPENASSLIEFRNMVNEFRHRVTGPLLVHCSAGVGRTGTYIALDLLTKEGEAEGCIDIYACVRNLREQRVKMVQTVEQYKFLHQALVYLLCGGEANKRMQLSTKL